ncbi:ATP-binding cassette domain-containing protein [Actinophytocola sp.]|uniref:ATP-binding cassette domain-containing protein n=1 Tax=Actinophytocola sp. TaxID=1872138 RepID=UPI002ED6727B
MTGCAIEASGVRKSFGDTVVLAGVDLRVERGTVLALLGPNGAGKTTLVRILSTLLTADGGTVQVDGHDVARDPRAVRGAIGLTGQDTAVDELLTGRENLVMMARLFHLGKAEARQRAEGLLDQFDLVEPADRQVRTYSGGMRRRLDIAASLITAPPVLFLDEPTTGLDPTSRTAMWELIRKLVADGTTILLTTQYLDEADSLANRVAVINGGRIVAEGAPDELKQQVGSERLTLTFTDEIDVRRAGELLGGDVDDVTLSLPIGAVDDVRAVLERTAQAGIPVHSMAITQPTLDDVFRTLTSGETR